jgi:type IV secretion system protein VirB9
MKAVGYLLLGLVFSLCTYAAELPKAGERDPHVRYVTYKKDEVVVIRVQRGVATRIMLDPEEAITLSAVGFESDCRKERNEWCVEAREGSNQILVKPKDNATHNNLEISTTKRDYSFVFRVLKDNVDGQHEGETAPMYRVIFRYPNLQWKGLLLDGGTRTPDEQEIIQKRLAAKPIPKNWNYTMQVLQEASDIAPTLVFDDGRFTYFKFPNNREVPAIFMLSKTGEESRSNVHMEGDLAVVEKLNRQFILRLGEATVGIWNESFDLDGNPVKTGVTVEGVKRVLK